MQEFELELHQQEEIPNEIQLPVEEISITPMSNGRNTGGKDISSTYSSLILKGRDKAIIYFHIQVDGESIFQNSFRSILLLKNLLTSFMNDSTMSNQCWKRNL